MFIYRSLLQLHVLLPGSEGKITVATQRMSMMTAVGELSANTVTGASAQNVISTAAELYLPVLQAECKLLS